MLKPNRFTSKLGFLDSWDTASKNLKKLDLEVAMDEHPFNSQIRKVLFYEPRELYFYSSHFIRN